MQEENSNKVLMDENAQMQFDFTSSVNVFEPHELANMYGEYISDTDFVIEGEDEIICMEYKNSAVKEASDPAAFQKKLKGDSFRKKLAKKFYGTLLLIWACDKNQKDKPIRYILLLETNPTMDSVLKKRLEAGMDKQLPFRYENREEIKHHIISEFCVLNLEQWEQMYPQYPIRYIRKQSYL